MQLSKLLITNLSRVLSIFREPSKLAGIEGIKLLGCIGAVRRNATLGAKNLSDDEDTLAGAGSGYPEEA
jgi:hypothetical protein